MSMASGSSDDCLVFISNEPKNGSWLIEIMKGHDPQSRPKPRIQKVANTLRAIESNKTCFDPSLVSLGPYHHGKEALTLMEPYKKAAARWFVSLATGLNPADTVPDTEVKKIYGKFVVDTTNASSLRDCYADNFTDEFDFEDFMRIMFLDGCFILHFIDLVVNRTKDLPNSGHLNQPLVVSDLFLLENQIPYIVLKALISLLPPREENNKNGQSSRDGTASKNKNIGWNEIVEKFIDMMFLPQNESQYLGPSRKPREKDPMGSNSMGKDGEPIHLLDILRIKLIGHPKPSTSSENSICHYYFRSIMELKAAGIKLSRSHSSHLNQIDFKKSFVYGHLSLPQMVVDDATKTRLLNLIAYEMCPDGSSSFESIVTSYICFLDSLIDHADDVKELRSKNILLNRLGSDKEVAKLFNELANNLMPNPKFYSKAMEGIETHCKKRIKVWFAEMLHTHFSSPWTIISLIAVIFILFVTVVQTVFTVWPK